MKDLGVGGDAQSPSSLCCISEAQLRPPRRPLPASSPRAALGDNRALLSAHPPRPGLRGHRPAGGPWALPGLCTALQVGPGLCLAASSSLPSEPVTFCAQA